jgi:hypothetical protein
MWGREERVAEGSCRRKALFRFVGSLALNSELIK